MKNPERLFVLGRRQLLQIGALSSLTMISSCRREARAPRLAAVLDTLPKPWRQRLPSPWKFETLAGYSPQRSKLNIYEHALYAGADAIAFHDGWLSGLKAKQLALLQPSLFTAVAPGTQACHFLESLPAYLRQTVLPVLVSPWVLLFRHGEAWIPQARISWSVLLDPTLHGRVVFPASARLMLSVARRISGRDSLRRLRSQKLITDDRHALNWLLQGEARVAVLPLSRCAEVIRRDPRLTVVLPKQGAPLHWLLLARSINSTELLPWIWVKDAWSMPLCIRLAAAGWRSPLLETDSEPPQEVVPSILRETLWPPENVWQRCWSLLPLGTQEREQLLKDWRRSTP